MTHYPEPSEQNSYLQDHAQILLRSYTHWTGRTLVDPTLPPAQQARQLFYAPFVVLSHTAAPDPIFNYSNRTALALFEYTWDELTCLPSRMSAEPTHQEPRAQLFEVVTRQGYSDAYQGVRIAKSGRRFLMEGATIWNLLDEGGAYCGQAATFSQWAWL